VVSNAIPLSFTGEQHPVGRICGVVGEPQHRVGAVAAKEVDDRLEGGHRGRQPGAVELGDAPGVGRGEVPRALVGVGQQAVRAHRSVVLDERLEVPGNVLDVHDGHGASVPQNTSGPCGEGPRRQNRRGSEPLGVLSVASAP
jgi:hypothetical protein